MMEIVKTVILDVLFHLKVNNQQLNSNPSVVTFCAGLGDSSSFAPHLLAASAYLLSVFANLSILSSLK